MHMLPLLYIVNLSDIIHISKNVYVYNVQRIYEDTLMVDGRLPVVYR